MVLSWAKLEKLSSTLYLRVDYETPNSSIFPNVESIQNDAPRINIENTNYSNAVESIFNNVGCLTVESGSFGTEVTTDDLQFTNRIPIQEHISQIDNLARRIFGILVEDVSSDVKQLFKQLIDLISLNAYHKITRVYAMTLPKLFNFWVIRSRSMVNKFDIFNFTEINPYQTHDITVTMKNDKVVVVIETMEQHKYKFFAKNDVENMIPGLLVCCVKYKYCKCLIFVIPYFNNHLRFYRLYHIGCHRHSREGHCLR